MPQLRSRALSVAPVLRYGTTASVGISACALSRMALNIGEWKSLAGESSPRSVTVMSTWLSPTTCFSFATTLSIA